jgi:hypothetical protein
MWCAEDGCGFVEFCSDWGQVTRSRSSQTTSYLFLWIVFTHGLEHIAGQDGAGRQKQEGGCMLRVAKHKDIKSEYRMLCASRDCILYDTNYPYV